MGTALRFRFAAVAVAVAIVLAALGAPLGWLWAALAPDVPVVVADGGVVPTQAEPEGFFAGDGWFVLLGLGFGVLVALALWIGLRRYRGPVILVALTVGTVGAAVIAWWIGHRIGWSGYRNQVLHSAPGTHLERPPELRAKELGWWFGFIPRVQGDLLIPAVTAAIAYTMLSAWSRQPSLRPGNEGAGAPAGESGQLELGGTASSDSGTGTALS